MTDYRVFLAVEVIEFADREGLDRRDFTLFLRGIAAAPNKDGDYTEADESGRPIEITIYGNYAGMYYFDHAVKELKVTDIEYADQ